MPQPHFTPGKDLVPILQEAGWAPGSVWMGKKSHPHRDLILDRIYYKWCGVILNKGHVTRNTDAMLCNLCNRMDSMKLIQYSICTQQ